VRQGARTSIRVGDVRALGDSLEASCRRIDGSWQRTGLRLSHCNGDIANQNGHLTCGGGGYGSSYDRDRGTRYDRNYNPGPYNDYRRGYGYGR